MQPTTLAPTTGLGSTAETNRLLGGTYFTEGQGGTGQLKPFVPINPSNSVSTGVLGTQPYNLPPTDNSSTVGSLTMANNSAASQIKIDSSYEPANTTDTEKASLKNYLGGLLGGVSEQAGKEDQIRKDAQLQEKKDKALAVSNELDVLDKEYRDEVKNIRQTSGISTAAANAQINSAQIKYEDRRANVSLAYKVALQDYQGAEEIVNAKITSLDKQFNRQIQAYSLLKDLVYDDLTASEKIKADEQSRMRTDKAKTLTESYSATLNNAVQNNAPAWVLSAIDEAAKNPQATPASIATAAGKYGIDPIKQATLAEKYQSIAESKAKAAAATTALPGPIQTRVQGIAGQFDAEQAVKNYQASAEAIDAVMSAGTSPIDDIQRIYAVAKVFDPSSAVKEGEYDTVQEYATAMLQRAGLKAKRVFTNTGFLTPEARTFIESGLKNRLASSKKAYDNIYSEYGRRINKVTGGTDGTDYITDYSRAFDTPDTGKDVQEVNGVRYVKAEDGLYYPE